MDRIAVVAGICFRPYSILLGRRHAAEGRFAGYWEFPGGKVEAGETDEEALRREFHEELGCDVQHQEFFYDLEWRYPERIVELRFYLVKLNCMETEKLALNAHSELMWVDLDKALEMSVLPANVHILRELNRQKSRLEAFASQ